MNTHLPKPKLFRQTNASDSSILDHTYKNMSAPSSNIIHDSPPQASYYVVCENKDNLFEPNSPVCFVERKIDNSWGRYWYFCGWYKYN